MQKSQSEISNENNIADFSAHENSNKTMKTFNYAHNYMLKFCKHDTSHSLINTIFVSIIDGIENKIE